MNTGFYSRPQDSDAMTPEDSTPPTRARTGPRRPTSSVRPVRKSPRQFALSTAMIMLAAAALCVWATINRDQRNRRILTDSMEVYRRLLDQHYRTYGTLPPVAPAVAPHPELAPLDYYAEPATQFYATRTTDPVIIGYSPLAQLFVSYSGRSVIILEDRKLRIEWINEGRLRRLIAAQDKAAVAALERARAAPVRLPE